MSSERRTMPVSEAMSGLPWLTEARFVPKRYEPNYAYPLLVMFHGRGGDEHQLLSAMPSLSWRNYVGLSLRGPDSVVRKGREVGFSWGPQFGRLEGSTTRRHSVEPAAQAVRRLINGGPLDSLDRLEDAVFGAIRRLRQSLHVHSERIFLVGLGEGAAVAYRLALGHAERFAGVIAINGWLSTGAPLARLKTCRQLKSLVVHGEWNDRAPVDRARRDVATLRAGGLRVAFQSYPCGHRITGPMLRDVDTWLIHKCTRELV